jgi:hypothetical protein
MFVLSSRAHEKIIFPTQQTTIQVLEVQAGTVRLSIDTTGSAPVTPLPFPQLVERRLAIAEKGLAELEQHLASGRTAEAETILTKLGEDLHLLRRRLNCSEF